MKIILDKLLIPMQLDLAALALLVILETKALELITLDLRFSQRTLVKIKMRELFTKTWKLPKCLIIIGSKTLLRNR